MRKDANGLTMIAASMTIIAIVIGLVAHHDLEQRRERVRAEGSALANALSRISLSRLAPQGRQLGPLSLIRSSRPNSDFAYGAVVATSGETLDAVPSSVLLPAVPPGDRGASAWSSERLIDVAGFPDPIREFMAPIIEDSRLVAQVRIGFREPSYAHVFEDSSLHATLALLIFMMSPVAYLWLRSELRPLSEVARAMQPVDDTIEARIVPGAAPSDAIQAIVRRFQAFSEEMESRSESMSRERMMLLASTKVVAHEKNRIQMLLEALPDAVLALDETGKVTFASARAESLLHLSKEKLTGMPPSVWCPSPDLSHLIGRYSGSNGRLMRAEAIEISPEDLGQRRLQASVHPLASGEGMAIVFRDITREFIERQTQSEFLAHMAHELKAPLNVMSMYSESLLGEEAKDEAFRVDACNVIRDEIDRLNGLINNIFSIGRIESGHVTLDRQRVRTRELLADIFESVSREGSELSLHFEMDLPDTMQPTFADKQLLSIALKNLLTNAIKYNRPEGRVSLMAEEHEGGLTIRVSDTGLGIHEEDLEHIFEKFYRSEDDSVRKVAGHGLGLALVKEIVALHGGEIQIQSEFGQGSSFAFHFPRTAAIFREES